MFTRVRAVTSAAPAGNDVGDILDCFRKTYRAYSDVCLSVEITHKRVQCRLPLSEILMEITIMENGKWT